MKRLAVLFFLLLVWVLPGAARAEPNALPPDIALSIQPSSLKLPELPPEMAVEERGGWLRVAFPKGTESRVEKMLAEAEDYKAELAEKLGQDVLSARVEVRVARSPGAMAELAPASLAPPAWAVGIAYPPVRLILISLVEPASHEGTDVFEVGKHELAHVALADATQGHHVPLWFNEGVAIHFSGENPVMRTNALWQASMSNSLLPLSDVDTAYPRDRYEVNTAYAESADFVRFLLRDPDRQRFASLIERVRGGAAFERALSDAYGTDLRRLEFEWREGLSKRFTIWPALTGGSVIWVLGIGLLVLAWRKRRKKARATLDRWAQEEAAHDVLARLDDDETVPTSLAKSKLTIEHDGRWYTLH